MRGGEIKQLRWRDVDLMEKSVTICKSKTEAGERVIPLNSDAWNAVVSLYRRSQAFGDVRADHYIPRLRDVPFRPHSSPEKLALRMALSNKRSPMPCLWQAPASGRSVRET